VFQKLQKYFFIKQHQKLTNQIKMPIAFLVPEYSQKGHFSQTFIMAALF
jgi:hypothetical protein